MLKQKQRTSLQGSAGRRRVSPLMLIGFSVPMVLALIAGVVFVLPHVGSHAAAALNQNCTLVVPSNPLSAKGLATPYQLVATDPAAGPCNEANPMQSAFVQGAIINRDNGQISLYNPLVIDQGTTPAVVPTVPLLPVNRTVAIWFGFQAGNLTLANTPGTTSLAQGRCVNGLAGGDLFGQFAYCNAPSFFSIARNAIGTGQLKVPALGVGKDGQPCPTVRDFAVVDQDQSDNVTTTYLVTATGTVAQNTAANAAALQGATTAVNGSDNRLVAVALDGTLGCTPFMAPDLANKGALAPSLPLDELQAAAHQLAPKATVPPGDPMTLTNGNFDINKTNAYRRGVDQDPFAATINPTTVTTNYCNHILQVAVPRLKS